MKILKHISVVALFAAIFIANIVNLTIDNISYASLNTLLLISNASTEDPEPGLCEPVEDYVLRKIIIQGDPELPDGIYFEETTTKDCWDDGWVEECTRGYGLRIINIVGQTVFEYDDFETIIGC